VRGWGGGQKGSCSDESNPCTLLLHHLSSPLPSPIAQSTMRVHNTFLRLDEFGRGALDIHEFSQISGNTMSPLFLNRIFEEHVVTRRGARGTR
jgi:hypothetical protein